MDISSNHVTPQTGRIVNLRLVCHRTETGGASGGSGTMDPPAFVQGIRKLFVQREREREGDPTIFDSLEKKKNEKKKNSQCKIDIVREIQVQND